MISPHCASLLNVNASSTWRSYGSIQGTNETGGLIQGSCGYDNVGIGPSNATDITLLSQPIIQYGVQNADIAYLGLNPKPQFHNTFNPNITFLTSLKSSNKIPSLSFGLSVGAQYRQLSWIANANNPISKHSQGKI